MVVDGLVLTLLTLVFVVAQIVSHRWIKKVTNCYLFWVIIGAFWFIWLCVFRFGPDWTRHADATITNPGGYEDSIIISKAFLLDVCPFAGLAMCFSLMVDPSRKAARALSPIALIGGLITVASLAFDETNNARLTAQFIFIGDPENDGMKCYFILHFLQVVLSVGVMLNTPRNGWKGALATFGTIMGYYCYVAIVMAATGCRWNVSGLNLNDWSPDGEYHFVSEIFNIPVKACPYIGIPFLVLVGCGIVALKDYVFDRGWFAYGNAYSKRWYLWYDYNRYVVQKWI